MFIDRLIVWLWWSPPCKHHGRNDQTTSSFFPSLSLSLLFFMLGAILQRWPSCQNYFGRQRATGRKCKRSLLRLDSPGFLIPPQPQAPRPKDPKADGLIPDRSHGRPPTPSVCRNTCTHERWGVKRCHFPRYRRPYRMSQRDALFVSCHS